MVAVACGGGGGNGGGGRGCAICSYLTIALTVPYVLTLLLHVISRVNSLLHKDCAADHVISRVNPNYIRIVWQTM